MPAENTLSLISQQNRDNQSRPFLNAAHLLHTDSQAFTSNACSCNTSSKQMPVSFPSSSGVHVSSAVASTSGQVLVGGSGSIFNISPSIYANRASNPSTSSTCTPTSLRTSLPMPAMSAVHVQLQTTPTTVASHSRSNSCSQPVANPFMLKFKTNSIKVCQAYRKGYDGLNDTMGLVVDRAERRMISNVTTGVQFLGRESNSHYHCRLICLQTADSCFQGKDLVITDDVRLKLTRYQKLYLLTCLQVHLS